MTMKKRTASYPNLTALTVMALALTGALILVPMMYVPPVDPTLNPPIGFHYFVTISVHRAGEPEDLWQILYQGVPNLLTNNGLTYIKQQLGNVAVSNSSVGRYISLSETSDEPTASWVVLPDEISTSGLARAEGTYTSTGTGTWTIVKTFTSEDTFTVKVTGLHHASSGSGNLIAVVQFTTPVTLADGDSLQVTWSCSVVSG